MNTRNLFTFALILVGSALLVTTANAGVIHEAAASGNLDRLKTSLAADPTLIDAKNAQGCSPLFLSLDRGRTGAAIWLLENGASWQTLGSRAAAMAIRANSPRALELMLAAGAPAGWHPDYSLGGGNG